MHMSFVLELVALQHFKDTLGNIDAYFQIWRWALYHAFLELAKLPPSEWAGFFTGLHSNYIVLFIVLRLIAELYITLTVGFTRRNPIVPLFDLVFVWLLYKGLSPLPDGAFYHGLEGVFYLGDPGDRINPFSSLSKPQLLERLAFYSYVAFPFGPGLWVILNELPHLLRAGARTLYRLVIVPVQPMLVTPLFYVAEWLFALCHDGNTHTHIYLLAHNICINPRRNDCCALEELEAALSLVTDQARRIEKLQTSLASKDAEKYVLQRRLAALVTDHAIETRTLQTTLARKGAEILVLERQLAETHAAIKERDAIIEDRDATIQDMTFVSDSNQVKLVGNQERIEDTAAQIRSSEAENARLKVDAVEKTDTVGGNADKVMHARCGDRIQDPAAQIRSSEAESARLKVDAVEKTDTVGGNADKVMHARCEDRIQDPAAQIWSLEAENARKGARILDLINKRADRDARQTRELGTAPQECARLMQEFTEYEKNVALDDTRRSEETAAVARKNTDFSQELSDMDVYRRRLEDENACLKQEAQDNTGYALRETSLTQRVEELEQCLTTREEHYHQELEKKDAYNGRLQDENAHLKQGNAGFLLRAESLTQCAKELERRLATCYEQHCEKLNENAHLKQQAQGNVLRAESLAQDVEVLKRRLATREEQHRGELKEKDEYNSRLEDEHARLKQGGTDLVLRMSSLTQRMTEFQRHLTTCDEQHREELKEKDACNRRLEDENAYLKQQAQGNADCVLREASLVRGMERLEQLLAACEEEHRRELEKKDTLIQILENDKAATQIRCSGLQLRADNARAEAGVLATTVRSLSSAFASADSVLGHSSKMLEITQSQLADALARIEALEPVARELDVLKHELASLKGDLQCLDGVQGDKMACFPAHQRERGALAERFDVELPMVHDPTQQEKGLKHNAAESDNEDSKMLGYVDHGGHEALEAVMVDNWTQQEKEVKHAVAESDDEGSKMLGRVDYEGREDLEATMVDDPTRQEKGPNHTAAESDDVQSVRQPFLARLDEQVGEGEVCISEKPELTTENSGNREFGSRPSGEIDDIGDFAVVDEAQKLQPVCKIFCDSSAKEAYGTKNQVVSLYPVLVSSSAACGSTPVHTPVRLDAVSHEGQTPDMFRQFKSSGATTSESEDFILFGATRDAETLSEQDDPPRVAARHRAPSLRLVETADCLVGYIPDGDSHPRPLADATITTLEYPSEDSKFIPERCSSPIPGGADAQPLFGEPDRFFDDIDGI